MQEFWPKRWFPRIAKLLAIEGLEQNWLEISITDINIPALKIFERMLKYLLPTIKAAGFGFRELNETKHYQLDWTVLWAQKGLPFVPKPYHPQQSDLDLVLDELKKSYSVAKWKDPKYKVPQDLDEKIQILQATMRQELAKATHLNAAELLMLITKMVSDLFVLHFLFWNMLF